MAGTFEDEQRKLGQLWKKARKDGCLSAWQQARAYGPSEAWDEIHGEKKVREVEVDIRACPGGRLTIQFFRHSSHRHEAVWQSGRQMK